MHLVIQPKYETFIIHSKPPPQIPSPLGLKPLSLIQFVTTKLQIPHEDLICNVEVQCTWAIVIVFIHRQLWKL